jgi:dolichyl-phosphate-mannose-protein mannosyltransferase
MAAKGAKPMPVNGVVYSTNDLVPAYNQVNAAANTTSTANNTTHTGPNKPANRKVDYTSEGVKDNNIAYLKSSDWEFLGALTVLALFVRLFRIYQPSSVVFDEVHFGGFASKYIKGKFFMDVHPPLAKLLITLAGWLAGFDGNFDFKDIGKDYIEPRVPYVAMRLLPAICGVLAVPVMFLTLKAAGCKTATAAFGSALVIFENGLVTQSRLILLDSFGPFHWHDCPFLDFFPKPA